MATFDSYFAEDKPAPGKAPVTLAGKSFDSYFADEANIPEEGLNTVENKRGGAVREALQMTVPALATGGAGILSRPMGVVGKYGLDALAGAGSEKVLQALGISEESPTMIALSALAGPTGRLFGSAVTGAPKLIPGYRDAARAGLTEHVRALPGQIIPHGDPKAAYNAIQGNMNTIMPNWPELSATVAKHVTQSQQVNWPALKKMTNSTPLEGLVANIEQSLQGTPAQVIKEPVTGKGVAFGKPTGLKAQAVTVPAQPPGLTFENARANIEALSQLIRDGKGSAETGVLKDIKRAMLTDLENMPTPPGTPVAQWNEARAAYRDQKTSMALSDVIEQHTTSREGIEMVNPDGILKTLRTNKELRERLSVPQLEQLESTLKDWANASGGTRSKLAAMLTGMTIGGGPAGALAGWGAAEITTKALMHEGARKMIGNIIANPSVHNISRGTAIISAAVRGAFDEPGMTPMPFETEVVPGKVIGTLPTEARTDPKPIERSPAPAIPQLSTEDIKAKVTKAAKDTKLDPKLFHAVVSTESNYNPSAVSPVGAVGLTQLMPKTAAGLGVNPGVVDENLKGGATYLQSLIKKYDGDVGKALAAYNAGPGRVDKGGPLPQETQSYVAKIMMKLRGDKRDKEQR
jgi:hypothetical protein